MRTRVRGLRAIEREVLQERQRANTANAPPSPPSTTSRPSSGEADTAAVAAEVGSVAPGPASGQAGNGVETAAERASGVVLDYCAAVRGILNDDQGGALHPPGYAWPRR